MKTQHTFQFIAASPQSCLRSSRRLQASVLTCLLLLISSDLPATANPVVAWGGGDAGQTTPPPGLSDAVSISQGHDHTAALKSNGTVVAWGYSPYGQTAVPSGLSEVVAISAGGYHTLALRRDGSVVGWGMNRFGITTLPAGTGPVVAVAAGNSHSLALKPDGTVVGWGYNVDGEASPPAGLCEVVAIAAGYAHSLALRRDGTVVGWGWNAAPPPGLTRVVAISAGYHSLALRNDGSVVAWGGSNHFGQTNVPAGLTRVIAIAAGQNHSLALKDDGTVVAWGYPLGGAGQPPVGTDPLVAITTSTYFSTGLVDENMVAETFENGLAAWEVSGNVTTKSSAPYLAVEGSVLAAFNSGDSAPNGRLVRTLAVLPGYRYLLEFSVGNLSFNSRRQRLRVTVEDNGILPRPAGSRAPYLSDEIEITGSGGGATTWKDRSYIFAPESGIVKLTFEDISVDTKSLDLVLDGIRIWELPPDQFKNGGFEAGLGDWYSNGNVSVESEGIYRATEGGRVLAFNAENTSPGGTLDQWVGSTAGQRYRLEFDAGALAFNTRSQRLRVAVRQYNGKYVSSQLLTDEFDLPGNGRGTTAWQTKSYEFTPTMGALLVSFTDLSATTDSIDAVLDNVRLTRVFPNSPLANGSFEDGFSGWQLSTFHGGVSVESQSPYQATKGVSVAAFNSRNDPAYGSISQTFDTIPGKTYQLVFDVGNLAYGNLSQRLITHVDSPDGYRVMYRLTSIPGSPTKGATNWLRNVTCPFTARTEKSVVRFIDASTNTLSNDLILDNVRLLP